VVAVSFLEGTSRTSRLFRRSETTPLSYFDACYTGTATRVEKGTAAEKLGMMMRFTLQSKQT